MKNKVVYLVLVPLMLVAMPAFAEQDAVSHILESVNEARVDAGLNKVALGTNPIVQQHAEEMLANCYTSPWGMDGLKPYMRYALSGGDQYMSSIVYGPNYCITESDGYEPISLMLEIDNAITTLLNDTNFSSVLLDPYNTHLSVGIAYDKYNKQLDMLFEYDSIEWRELQMINNQLSIRGTLKSDTSLNMSLSYDPLPYIGPKGVRMDPPPQGPILMLHYDPPPSNLTSGQLMRTYCYDYGIRASLIVEKWIPKFYVTVPVAHSTCIIPSSYPQDIPEAASPEIAQLLLEAAKVESTLYKPVCFPAGGCFLVSSANVTESVKYTHSLCKNDGCFVVGNDTSRVPALYVKPHAVTFIEADVWHVFNNSMFNFQANVSDPSSKYGPGFYTIVMYGYTGDSLQALGAYTILHGIEP